MLEPLRGGSIFNLARLSHRLGRYEEAEAALRKAIELQPQAAKQLAAVCRGIRDTPRAKSGAAVELAKQEIDPF